MEVVTLASSILTRAVTYDNDGRYTESFVCYQEGLQILMEALKSMDDEDKKVKLRVKVKEYMDRAEKVKKHIDSLKAQGKYREQLQIEENSIGYSYYSVFSRFLDHGIREVEIDDPYIRSPHQCENLLRFVELCLKHSVKLKRIHLKTSKDTNNVTEQMKRLNTIVTSLKQCQNRNVDLTVQFEESLHDREIRLDNGWVVKIGRGLDYFKPSERFHVGWSDFDLRPCKATTIDVFHKKELIKCY